MNTRLLTVTALAIRSFVLLGVTVLALLMLGWLDRVTAQRSLAAEQARLQAEHQQQQIAELKRVERQYGSAVTEAAIASVPDDLDVPTFFAWLETEAAAQGVGVQYNFASLDKEEDERTPNQWTIVVDFLGPASALQALLTRIETGLYHVAITALDFDSTDRAASQLKLVVVLSGGDRA